MKLKVNWKELMKQLWTAIKPVLLGAIGGGIVGVASGCSSMTPSDKTQTMGVYAFGIPGIAVITQSHQTADNAGSDTNAAGDTVEAECVVIESAEDHIDATLPAAFNGDEFIGREITFKVEERCGDPEAGTQTKSIEAVLDKGDITAPKSSIVRVVCEGHESDPDILFDGGSVTIEGSGLAGATECTFTCQDKAGEKHDTVFGASDFTASADGNRIEISDDMLVGHMRNACSVAMSELDTEVDATVKVTLADGTILTYSVTIGK